MRGKKISRRIKLKIIDLKLKEGLSTSIIVERLGLHRASVDKVIQDYKKNLK